MWLDLSLAAKKAEITFKMPKWLKEIFLTLLQETRLNSLNMVKIEGAITYLKGVHFLRKFTLQMVGAIFCFTIGGTGLLLCHLLILFYTPWPLSVRVGITLGFAMLYIAISALLLVHSFRHKTWMKLFYMDHILDELVGDDDTVARAAAARNGERFKN